jgi:hypothetical protein
MRPSLTISARRRRRRTICQSRNARNCFRKVVGPQLEEAKLQKGEHPMELLELGETMVTKYIEDAAPLIRPAAVESGVSGVIGGVNVSGYVDLLDIEGRIIDSKSDAQAA